MYWPQQPINFPYQAPFGFPYYFPTHSSERTPFEPVVPPRQKIEPTDEHSQNVKEVRTEKKESAKSKK